MSNLVQYVILRGDLIKTLNWPLGAVITQACHASVACIHFYYNDSNTQAYLEDLKNMRKVVLEVPDELNLKDLSSELKLNGIDHKLWTEQPENVATCLVTKPYPKQQIQCYFKKYKLFVC